MEKKPAIDHGRQCHKVEKVRQVTFESSAVECFASTQLISAMSNGLDFG
jgi:hypothetical protein